ncbi:hypothetical protein JCM10212_006023 [Sporobolomyces blumeae]
MSRSPASRSPSPPARRARADSPAGGAALPPVSIPRLPDHDPARRRERERQMALQAAANADSTAVAKPRVDPMVEVKKMQLTRGGGTYIPPHRLRAMMAEQKAEDKDGEAYQRMSWEALKKSINGLINKVNVSNIKLIVPELFGENLIRGKGLFVQSMMRAQASSLPFTPIFASLVAIVNTKLPQIGELLLNRLIRQFLQSYKRNNKPAVIATATFLAQLVNQQVAHEVLALQMLVLLLERPTDDSVEIAVSFMREVGAFLAEHSARANNGIFDRFRTILNESAIDKRVQYMVEVLFQVRKDKYKDNPIIPEGLDLVEEEDIITHRISLDDEVNEQRMLNVFKFDLEYSANEEAYAEMKREILGDSDDEDESGEEGDTEDGSDAESDVDDGINADGTVDVHDQSGVNKVNLQRSIYLTIMSALDFEEATHKLLKIDLGPGQEQLLCEMVVRCCSQERTFSKFYGLMGERFCKLNQVWQMAFEQLFAEFYTTIHREDTNKLRNIARFFGHLLMTDAISWTVMDTIKMNEDDTTSSSRIFVKIMFQEIIEGMGLVKLKERFKEDQLQPFLGNIFPVDNPKNTRFSINFFTSIGLGAITENMREHLKRAPALMANGAASPARSGRSLVRLGLVVVPLFVLALALVVRLLVRRLALLPSPPLPPLAVVLALAESASSPCALAFLLSLAVPIALSATSPTRPVPFAHTFPFPFPFPFLLSLEVTLAASSTSRAFGLALSATNKTSPPPRGNDVGGGGGAPRKDFIHPDRARLAAGGGGGGPPPMRNGGGGGGGGYGGRGGFGGGRGGYGGGGGQFESRPTDSGWGSRRQ